MKNLVLAMGGMFLAAAAVTAQGGSDRELRWDLTAGGCDPRRPVPSVAAEPTGIRELSAGVVQAWWDRPGQRSVIAEFRQQDGSVYALCQWDTTGA